MQATQDNSSGQNLTDVLPQMTAGAGALAPEVANCLLRTQALLASQGWSYVFAPEPDAWPLSGVVMSQSQEMGGSTLLIAPLVGGRASAWLSLWAALPGIKGLLLVGDQGVDDPQVAAMVNQARPAVAYIDAVKGQFLSRNTRNIATPAVPALTNENLQKFVDPRQYAGLDEIYIRHRIQSDVAALEQQQAFYRQVAQARGGGRIWLTYALTVICVAVFLAMTAGSDTNTRGFLAWGANNGELVRLGQWWRLVTDSFLHGDIVHLAFNMMAMVYLGRVFESMQGAIRFASVYFFSVIAASLASIFWHGSGLVGVGASGGLFGIMGGIVAMLVLYGRHWPGGVKKSLRSWVGTMLLYNLAFFFIPHIDGAAHVGGLLGGLAMGMVLCRPPEQRQRLSAMKVAMAAALLAATAGAGYLVVQRVPLASEPVPATAPDDDGQASMAAEGPRAG